MTAKHLMPAELSGRVIDIHNHIGSSLKAFACREYPYAQSIEGLYYRQLACNVDVSVVFPCSPDLFFEPVELLTGSRVPARRPLSDVPYGTENAMVLNEVFEFCPELQHRFIPFICVDPGREIPAQIRALERLDERYPLYGIKISPVFCQSRIIELLDAGRDLLDFARERDLPLLIHSSADIQEIYTKPDDLFAVIAANPDLRFCLAHCLNFDRRYLKRMAESPNVWVDTAAIKIQVRMIQENYAIVRPPEHRLDVDYSDYRRAMIGLVDAFPDRVIWGSDSPYYVYICRRKQAEGRYAEYRLKATYEDEKAALDALAPHLRVKVANTNSLSFLFGL